MDLFWRSLGMFMEPYFCSTPLQSPKGSDNCDVLHSSKESNVNKEIYPSLFGFSSPRQALLLFATQLSDKNVCALFRSKVWKIPWQCSLQMKMKICVHNVCNKTRKPLFVRGAQQVSSHKCWSPFHFFSRQYFKWMSEAKKFGGFSANRSANAVELVLLWYPSSLQKLQNHSLPVLVWTMTLKEEVSANLAILYNLSCQ